MMIIVCEMLCRRLRKFSSKQFKILISNLSCPLNTDAGVPCCATGYSAGEFACHRDAVQFSVHSLC